MKIPAYNRIPRGYGIAYRLHESDFTIAYPIPLNILVAFFRRIYIWFLRGANLYRDGYDRGYGKGLTEGRDYAFNQFKVHVIRQEIPTIVKNLIKKQEDILNERYEKNIEGWILDFIEEEQKRLSI